MNFFIVKMLSVSLLINIVSGTIQFYDDKQNHTVEIIESISAAFGPRIDSDEGFKGYIVVANPLGGCTTLDKPPNVTWVAPDEWIVLIKRTPTIFGNCSFDWKVNNAQMAGYKAVIIYNSESDNLIKMSSSGKYRIRIPSVFISRSDGLLIERSYTYMNHTYAVINNDDDNLSYLLIPFICVVAVCFIIAVSIFVSKFIYHLYKLRKNRFPKSALKKIPTKKYSKTDKYDTCPICLNEYEEGEKMRILPCEHAYHVECIDKWLLRNNRFCPVCKRRVLPGGSDSESDDGHEPQTPNVRRAEMNAPNEDEDTNESSRLLVNVVRANSNEDNISASTISTLLNNNNTTVATTNEMNTNNAQQFGDMSSMNNQMTASTTSSQAPNPNLKASSSRYGSISSSLNIVTATTNKPGEIECEYERPSILRTVEAIDSKQTPEFHSPIEIAGSVTTPFESITTNTQSSDLPQVAFCGQQQLAPSKKNSKKGKKSSSQQDETVSQQVQEHSDSDSNRIKSCTDSGENLQVDTSDKKALIQTNKDSTSRSSGKSKKSKKKSSSQATPSSSNMTDQQSNGENN